MNVRKLFKRFFPSKEMRAYRKMHRRHRKELVKLAKEAAEWDYCFMDQFVRTQIKHMQEYYFECNNVQQTDETRLLIMEQLKYVLNLYYKLDNLWETNKSDYDQIMKKEQELYEEIYSYIGQTIRGWWD